MKTVIEIFRPHNLPKLTDPELSETVMLTCAESGIQPASVNLVFLNQEELCRIHADFLNDPSPTDVITFDLGDDKIEAEIYIGTDMAREDAEFYGAPFDHEIHRLIIHGLLHLAGYDDHEPGDRIKMKREEERLLSMRVKQI